MHMQHTVYETHILKIISFISSSVNRPGSVRKLSLTIMISRIRSTTATRSDEIPHRPHRPQIFNILLTSNRTGATVCVYAMNSI